MTNLEQFLNNEKDMPVVAMEPASGSFQCQNTDCDELVYEGYIDRAHGRLKWTCTNGHDSSVVI